jgi:hypothetical protein
MTDPIVVKRLTRRLAEAGEATPRGEGYWLALAQFAADEATRTVTVTQIAVPDEPFLAVTKTREGFHVVGRGATLAALTAPVTAFLEERGRGEVWITEVRRVLEAS